MAENYTNTASTASLQAGCTSGATSITVQGVSGWPAVPFFAIIARGTASAEIVRVTAVGGSTWTVTRGQDGTLATAHNGGDLVEHPIPAKIPNDLETHKAASTGVHGLSGAVVGTTDAQTLSGKKITGSLRAVFSDAVTPAWTTAFEVAADNANSKDGFVFRNTAAAADRTAFGVEQSGSPRFKVDAVGKVHLTPAAPTDVTVENDGVLQQDGNATFGGTVAITGATTVGGALAVNALATVDDLDVNGTADVTGAVTVGGALTVGGLLDVNANADVSGTLTVGGASTLGGAVTVSSGNLSVANGYLSVRGEDVILGAGDKDLLPHSPGLMVFDFSEFMLYRSDGVSWFAVMPMGGGTGPSIRYEWNAAATTNQIIATSDQTTIAWQSAAYSTDAINRNTLTNVFTVQKTGLWLISANVAWSSTGAGTGARELIICNSDESTTFKRVSDSFDSDVTVWQDITLLRRFTAGDTFQIAGFHTRGVNATVALGSIDIAMIRS